MRNLGFIVLILIAVPAAGIARGDETPRTGVVDRAGVMKSGEMQQLNAWLLELEQKTGAQLKVLIVPSTDGRDIYSYSIDMARKWRLGQKGKNNGALVVVAVNDHKYHIQTGEGIEGAVPDLLTDQIAQTYFIPNFKKGDYSHGIYLGTIELARAIAKDSGIELGGLPAQQQQRVTSGRRGHGRGGNADTSCCAMIIPVIVILFIFGGIMARANRMNRGMWGHGRRGRISPGSFFAGMLLNSLLNSSSRGGSNWGGGWGGGGGGGGGFGGGGGGSFGGGGSGGSW